MTVKRLKLAGKEFVILSRRDYVSMRDRLKIRTAKLPGKAKHKMSRQDYGDVAEAKRRLADPNDREWSLADVKRELGF